eukprot:Amastigsp_a175122_138.p6 type:complete len:103 gc:universal Amastigsp_a175122_138:1487-1179(-)
MHRLQLQPRRRRTTSGSFRRIWCRSLRLRANKSSETRSWTVLWTRTFASPNSLRHRASRLSAHSRRCPCRSTRSAWTRTECGRVPGGGSPRRCLTAASRLRS